MMMGRLCWLTWSISLRMLLNALVITILALLNVLVIAALELVPGGRSSGGLRFRMP